MPAMVKLSQRGLHGSVAAVNDEHLGLHQRDRPQGGADLIDLLHFVVEDVLILGATGDPIEALERVLVLARSDMAPHIVPRELIQLSHGNASGRPVLGMFLGGAGLANIMLYCRYKIYPLGLPNGLSHVLAAIAGVMSIFIGIHATFLPKRPQPIIVSILRSGQFKGSFALLMVTTLEKLLLGGQMPGSAKQGGALKMMVIERTPRALMRALIDTVRGRLANNGASGVHLQRGDEIRIEGDHSSVILDGELFEANRGRPIILRTTAPIPFLRLAA